ncbi:glycerol kinase GlpK [Gorillibacterium timonense]|uniref:glycerol kinase GlpK n=1 Tax=Gorillibacterium timonense TaxID=1689269 RepID=UPI00071D462C|nr:glycerol kinase GlpK [Gorillibacterium timonense]
MERPQYILALDQGTTSCRAIWFNQEGQAAGTVQREYAQSYPRSGWVEQDAAEIWSLQREVMREAASRADGAIAAIGITNQRETVIVWDKLTGKPLHPAIGWQCRRTAEQCAELKANGLEDMIRAKTGLLIDPYFSGTKLAWLLREVPGLREKAERGEALFGTVDSWLIWNLTCGRVHATDVSNASRTMLFNIHKLEWDEELCRLFGVPAAMLPEVRPSSGDFGVVTGIPECEGIPIAGAAGDQQAALFGQACHEEGMLKNTYGTGCFLLMNTGERPADSRHGLLTTVAWQVEGRTEYALEGSVFTAGAVVQWLRDGLSLIREAGETEALALSVPDTDGIYFVPAFNGLGTPYWNPDARGMITGISRGTRKEHIVRAALEAVAYQTADVIRVMERESGIALNELRADGGMVRNRFLMQFQADILNRSVSLPEEAETTALGAAYLAGLHAGFWSGREEIRQRWTERERYTPRMEASERERLYAEWERAVKRQLR